MPSSTEPTVARFWTRARRFPRLIGKTVNGDRIPGGPYTTAQALGGFLTIWLLWETRSIWGWGQIIAELLFIAAAGYGVLWLLGKVPLNTRNPIILAAGFLGAVFSPRRGRTAGRGIATRDFGPGPRRMFGTQPAPVWNGPLPGAPFSPAAEEQTASPTSVADPAPAVSPPPLSAVPKAPASVPEQVSSPPVEPASSSAPQRELTGLQRMLADAARTSAAAATTDDVPQAENADTAYDRTYDGDDWIEVGHRVAMGRERR